MDEYLLQNWVELLGALLSIMYLYYSIRQKLSLWVFGFLCSALYVVVFFQSKFYADMTLQIYYVGVSVFGWVSWKLGKLKCGHELPVKKTSLRHAGYLALITLTVFLLYYIVLSRFTDSPLPFADSLTTAMSIVATWMLARKLIEHWLMWIVIDALSAGLYFYKSLYPTAILFVVYTIMAVVGYFQWKKTMGKEID